MNVTFITGNQKKADALSKWLGQDIPHHKLELDEIQSTNVKTVVKHKAEQAYKLLGKPVLCEDVGLRFNALNTLPGALIKWFVEEAGLESLTKMLDGFDDRSATAICVWGYCDENGVQYIEGSQKGTIASRPAGAGGFGSAGWDAIFIPEGNKITRAEMPEEDYRESYTAAKNYQGLRELLEKIK